MNKNQIDAMMMEAVRLAAKGYPAPNPHVGCVIRSGGILVGRGFHKAAGLPHAEAEALGEAGELARGGEAFVTMEPCNHHGRTPPCSEALIRAGIKRVYIGQKDPNPKAQGGIEKLLDAGVEVFTGILEPECREVNLRWLTAIERRRPWVTLKAAITMDGRIAKTDGSSKWITGEEARAEVHKLRAEHSAILVGPGTAAADNPSLTARTGGVINQPMRVVLDPDQNLPADLNLWNDDAETLLINPESTLEGDLAMVKWHGRHADLGSLLDFLLKLGRNSLLVEGGSGIYRSFLDAGLVDEIRLFMAPKLFGSGLHWLPEGCALTDEWRSAGTEQFGEDTLLKYRRSIRDDRAGLI